MDTGEASDQGFGHRVREVFLVWIVGQVLERQDCHGGDNLKIALVPARGNEATSSVGWVSSKLPTRRKAGQFQGAASGGQWGLRASVTRGWEQWTPGSYGQPGTAGATQPVKGGSPHSAHHKARRSPTRWSRASRPTSAMRSARL